MVSCPGFNLTFDICGTQVSIHWIWVLFYALTILGSFTYKNIHFTTLVIILDGPILLFTIVTDMIGESMMVKLTGGSTEGVVIFPFWGIIKYGQPLHNKGPGGDLRIAMAGPMMYILQGAAWFGLFFLAAKGDMFYFNYWIYENLLEENFFAVLFSCSVILNIVLLVLNMLPGYPLAGGRILAAVLLMKNVEKPRVALIVGKSGLVVTLIGCIYGLVTFFVWETSDSVFVFTTCLVVGWYSAALIKRSAERNLDEHSLFQSSSSGAPNVNNVSVMGGGAVVETGQVNSSQTDDKKPWWKGGEKKNTAGAATNEPEVDYGYS